MEPEAREVVSVPVSEGEPLLSQLPHRLRLRESSEQEQRVWEPYRKSYGINANRDKLEGSVVFNTGN